MVSSQTIRDKVAEWLRGSLRLEEFHQWFASETVDAYEWPDYEAKLLASRIDLLLAEYTGGHLSLDALIRDVEEFVRPFASAENQYADPFTALQVNSFCSNFGSNAVS
jgi:hypothetical protein